MDKDVFVDCTYTGPDKCIPQHKFTWDNGEHLDDKIQLRFEVDGVQTRDNATFGCTVYKIKNNVDIWMIW